MSHKKKGPYTVTSTREVYKNKWITVTEDSIIHPDGREGIWATFDILEGIAVLPIDDQENVYIGEGFRYAIDSTTIEAFAGGKDKDETPLETAQRELEEESGIKAETWVHLGKARPFSTYTAQQDDLFLALDLTFNDKTDTEESFDVLRVPLGEAIQMVMNNEISDQATQILILKAKHYLDKQNK